MKTKYVLWVVVILLTAIIFTNRVPTPLVIDKLSANGRAYFCVYELKQGETHEQVKSEVTSDR